jgi:2-polyprenyl-6-methoxyphenol hydroxylase-like FAD-dependent oxidoreductase
VLCHRIRLHEALKHAAITPDRPNRPAVLNTAARVIDCDPSTASITLENGEKITGDLVIGADGVSVGYKRSNPGLQVE